MDCKLVTREANWEVLPVVQVGNEVDLHESGSGESGFKRCLAWRIILLVFLMAGSLIQVCRESLPGAPSSPSPPCSTLHHPVFDWFKAQDTIWHYAISIISYYMTYFLQHWFTQLTTFARWQLRKSFVLYYWPSNTSLLPSLSLSGILHSIDF